MGSLLNRLVFISRLITILLAKITITGTPRLPVVRERARQRRLVLHSTLENDTIVFKRDLPKGRQINVVALFGNLVCCYCNVAFYSAFNHVTVCRWFYITYRLGLCDKHTAYMKMHTNSYKKTWSRLGYGYKNYVNFREIFTVIEWKQLYVWVHIYLFWHVVTLHP